MKFLIKILIVLAVLASAFVMNIPLGVWRSRVRKFSVKWFVAVHLSIPIIIYLRLKTGMSFHFIPFTLGLAVLGQMVGANLNKN